MNDTIKRQLLNYTIPAFMVIVIIVQLFLVYTKQLSRWKGGGYGMYTEIHYSHNQIYIQGGISVDSLEKDMDIKEAFKFLRLMPNKNHLEKVAKLVLKKTQRDSIHMQIWKPKIDLRSGLYTRVLIDEVYLKSINL